MGTTAYPSSNPPTKLLLCYPLYLTRIRSLVNLHRYNNPLACTQAVSEKSWIIRNTAMPRLDRRLPPSARSLLSLARISPWRPSTVALTILTKSPPLPTSSLPLVGSQTNSNVPVASLTISQRVSRRPPSTPCSMVLSSKCFWITPSVEVCPQSWEMLIPIRPMTSLVRSRFSMPSLVSTVTSNVITTPSQLLPSTFLRDLETTVMLPKTDVTMSLSFPDWVPSILRCSFRTSKLTVTNL
mmetsp:Transcript_66672/g.100481  ORF Transcript_66672/g.100481 Transcript_66672/m.100481 type:complete len:240 (+) Transcript_66672:722-1441(+)